MCCMATNIPYVFDVLMQVNIKVECSIVKDSLKGQDSTELYLKLLSQEAESYPFKDDD